MRLHRFFIEERIGEKNGIVISDKDVLHQWSHVFRMKPNDRAILLDNSGFEFVSEIVSLAKDRAELRVVEKKENKNVPQREIFLFQSMIKKDKFEWVLEKGTEIGVAHFRPVRAERSEKQNVNIERARKIVKEASEQCGRATLPSLYEPMTIAEVLRSYSFPVVAFHSEGELFQKNNFAAHGTVGILIGPEGGWSDAEIALFREKNISLLSLGLSTLRSETAAIVASATFLI